MIVSSFQVPAFCDPHVHLRQPDGEHLGYLLRQHSRHSSHLLAKPNTVPPLADAEALRAYRKGLDAAWGKLLGPTSAISQPTTEGWVKLAFLVEAAQDADAVAAMASVPGVLAGKLYPKGMTTHSESGVDPALVGRWKQGEPLLDGVLGAMSELGLALCVHAESPLEQPGVGSLADTETSWIPFLKDVLDRFARLRVVVEHVTAGAMADFVARHASSGRLAATVTPQHLLWHLGDLFRGGLRPFRYCKPLFKYPADRQKLWHFVKNLPNFFLGSDSAPHCRQAKLAECGCAGVFSAPVLPEVLAEAFEAAGHLQTSFADFTSRRARDFYRLEGGLAGTLEFHRVAGRFVNERPDLPTAWDGQALSWKAARLYVTPKETS